MAVKRGVVREIAAERIKILYLLSVNSYDSDPELSKRYARLIKQIGRHYKITLDKEIKQHICKKCGSILIPGKNMKVTIASSKRLVLYRCLNCGTEKRLPY
jgi:ribonuclease P protein subunit RPR2